MTIQQLEYIIAVDNFRHFAKAAEACRVTQPTLSMMIQKLEDELEVKIFDRMTQPVQPTTIGEKIIHQARGSVYQFNQIKELVYNEKDVLKGDFKMGIIPTIASYLVPELLKRVRESNTEINLMMEEVSTSAMIENILCNRIDGGLAMIILMVEAFQAAHGIEVHRFISQYTKQLRLKTRDKYINKFVAIRFSNKN